MANDTNILNIDTLDLSKLDNYSLIDTFRNTPFKKIQIRDSNGVLLANQTNMEEGVFQGIAERNALDFFILMIKKNSEVFILGNVTNGSSPEIEYERLSAFISNALTEISLRRNGLLLTGIPVNITGNPTVDMDYSIYGVGDKNTLQNEKLLLLIQQYIDFQKQNSYPASAQIIITDNNDQYHPRVTFSIQSNIIGTSTITDNLQEPTLVPTDEVDTFSEFIDEIINDLTDMDMDVYVHKKLSRLTDYSNPIFENRTQGLFKCEGEKLTTFYTGSVSSKTRKYYIPVYDKEETSPASYRQFDISFAHISGSGSYHVENEQNLLPSKTMFRKYLLDCFGTNEGKFPFKNGKNGDYFYAIHINRDLFKDKLDAGNFELCLAPLTSSDNQLYNTGSNCRANQSSSFFFTLVDESGDTKEHISDNELVQDYYYITSGSLRDGVYGDPEDDAWGVVFPKTGLIILDGVVLDQSCSFNTVTASMDGDNIQKLFLSISGSSSPTLNRTVTGSFFGRSSEECLVATYFCRANYYEFNYSSNYTFVESEDGEIRSVYLKNDPSTFITTIGLYNKNNDLVAVGKLPKPVLKNDGIEHIFQVKLRLN